MAGAPDKPADPEWIHTLKRGGPVPFSDSYLCSHAWAAPPGHNFFVRGPYFPEIMTKVPSAEPLLQPIAFDFIKSSYRTSNFMEHPQCRVRAALQAARESAKSAVQGEAGCAVCERPFVWVFNLQFPSKDNLSMVMYFVSFRSPEKGSLMQRFLDGDDEFRNEHLKMISTIPEGPRIVKLVRAERGPACLLGKLMNCSYRREKEYIEVDVDMGSSMFVRAAFQICGRFAVHTAAEFAFLIEGRRKSELPERVVGAMKLANLDFSTATCLDGPLLITQEPVSKEKQKASCRGLWKTLSALVGQVPPVQDVDEVGEEKLAHGLAKAVSFP